MTTYHTGRTLAIVAGAAATGGAIWLLLGDAIATGHWSQDHMIVPLVVGLTVATGHLASTALRRGKLLAAIGFAIAFAVGTSFTVLNGVGRQSEGVAVHMNAAAKHNQAVADTAAELSRARLRLEQANQMADKEMTGSTCARRCNDWKTRAKEVEARIEKLEAGAKALGAVRPVNAKAEKVGELATALGIDGTRAATLYLLIEPVQVPFMLEWTAIIALGYGFGHRRTPRPAPVAPVAAVVQQPAPETPAPVPPKGTGKRGRKPDPKVVDFVARYQARNGRQPSGSEIKAQFPELPKSTAYDYARRVG